MWDSAPTLPYRISAQSCWRRAAAVGYLALDDAGKVRNDILPLSAQA
jgi:hypothetical protein